MKNPKTIFQKENLEFLHHPTKKSNILNRNLEANLKHNSKISKNFTAVPKFFPNTFGKESRKAINKFGFPMGTVSIRPLEDLDEEDVLIQFEMGKRRTSKILEEFATTVLGTSTGSYKMKDDSLDECINSIFTLNWLMSRGIDINLNGSEDFLLLDGGEDIIPPSFKLSDKAIDNKFNNSMISIAILATYGCIH